MKKIFILLIMSLTGIYNDTGVDTKFDYARYIIINKQCTDWQSEASLILMKMQG